MPVKVSFHETFKSTGKPKKKAHCVIEFANDLEHAKELAQKKIGSYKDVNNFHAEVEDLGPVEPVVIEVEGVSPVTKEMMDERNEIASKLNSLNSVIEDRLDYIIRKSLAICGYEVDWWSYNYDYRIEEDSYQDINTVLDTNYGEFSPSIGLKRESNYDDGYDPNYEYNTCFVVKGGNYAEKGVRCLADGFPLRWLTEDFEEELIEGRKIFAVEWEKRARC